MKPVFIIGAGRSGTTLLYKLLCLNDNFAWVSHYMEKFPNVILLSVLNRINTKLIKLNLYSWFSKNSNAFYSDRELLKKIFPTPAEGEAIYQKAGFETFPDDNWKLDDKKKDDFRSLLRKITSYQGKEYFLSKRTANNRRIDQLLQCFPDAKFIHVIRDGRAVAYSLTKVKWWDHHQIWWMDKKKPYELRRNSISDIELAAKNWVEELKCINSGIKKIDANNIITIKYEDFVEDPFNNILKIFNYIGMKPKHRWLKLIKKNVKTYNRNRLWEVNLNNDEKELVIEIQFNTLKKLNYIN